MSNDTQLKIQEVASLNAFAWFLMQERDYETLKGVEAQITQLLNEIDDEVWN